VNHVALNLKPSRRPFMQVAEELAEHILPKFVDPPRTEPTPVQRVSSRINPLCLPVSTDQENRLAT
jgi:hypothetical protein